MPLALKAEPDIFQGRSLSARRWVMRECDERLALTLAQRFSLPDIAARVMASRGVLLTEAADFLDPTLKRLLPDPFHLKDMGKAVVRMKAAIEAAEKICVFGDYDVDGATSTALIIRFCRALGVKVGAYIPDRMAEGYGPNAAALRKLAGEGVKLVITVDCGITAHEALEAAKVAGLDVIVLDHHMAEPRLPPAAAIVNPNRLDENSPHGHLAAVGVTFLFLVALNSALRDSGFYNSATPPDLMSMLDLVALGTVADIVPLKGVNRALVRQGLRVMAASNNAGIRVLLNIGRASGFPEAYTAGFILGPRVNAGGRVGKSDLGVRLLSTDDEVEASTLAVQLDKLNDERRKREADAVTEAQALVPQEASSCVMVTSESWHPGVIGLVASRLKDRFNLPSFTTVFDGETGKGSCRSVSGIDIGALIIAARQEGLLINGGGHAMAAGFTVARGAYENFRAFVEMRISRILDETPIEPTLHVDGMLSVSGVTVELAEKLQLLAPYGAGNPEPRFALMDARLLRVENVGENHLRVILAGDGGAPLRAMAWRVVDSDMGRAFVKMQRGQRLNLAGTLRLNSWGGRTEAQFIIEDAALA